jgi:hypothetical protein
MFFQRIDYDQLKAIMHDRLALRLASRPNAVSALAEFLRERRISSSDVVGLTLRTNYEQELASHVATLSAEGRSRDYIKNRRALLEHWHRLVRDLDHEGATVDGTETPIQVALRTLMQGRQYTTTAKLVGMSSKVLDNWVKRGSIPKPRAVLYLTRLEELGGLVAGSFTDLLPYNASRQMRQKETGPTIEYRARQAKLTRDPYRLTKNTVGASLQAEWRLLLASMTVSSEASHHSAEVSGLELMRSTIAHAAKSEKPANKRWRLVPPDTSESLEGRWIDAISGNLCVTAQVCFAQVASFLGWAELSLERGGLGLSPSEAQTLGLFCESRVNPRAHLPGEEPNQYLVEAYLEWRVSRSVVLNQGVTTFLAFAASLLHPETGFLPTNSAIAARIGLAPDAWRERCKVVHAWTTARKKALRSVVRPSRDPKDPIHASLDLEMPLDNFTLAIRRMVSCRPMGGGIRAATHSRDELLMTLGLSNALRARNLQRLTYYPDNSGQLRQNSAGAWRICIERPRFKNARGQATVRPYDQAVDEAVWPFIRRYLKEHRKVLGGSRPELVFVSGRNPNKLWGKALNSRFAVITKQYVPGCPGVGPQSLRHLVCSSIIMRGGGSDESVRLAALTLHDDEMTIRKHYEHLLASFSDRARKESLGSSLAQMSLKSLGLASVFQIPAVGEGL